MVAQIIFLQILNPPAIINNVFDSVHKYVTDIVHNVYKSQACKLLRLEDKHSRDKGVHCKHTFYPHVLNLTSMSFNALEMNILNNGINYCIPPTFNKITSHMRLLVLKQ